jgi:choline-sulfatase
MKKGCERNMLTRKTCNLFIPVFCLAAFCVATSCKRTSPESTAPASTHSHQPYNVLLITLDTFRYDYLSCNGSKKVQTPHLDAVANRGVRFETAITAVPLTTPAHASILTGAYPPIHKIRDNGGFVLDPKIPTLAALCNQAGMSTAAMVGAAVLDHFYGMNRGFQKYDDEMNVNTGADLLPGVVAEVRAEVVTRRGLDWVRQWSQQAGGGKNREFLLWLHYYDPHFPYDPPAPYRTQYARDLYAGEVAYVDAKVGELLKGLSDLSLLDKTLVVIVGDHGEGLGDHGEYTHGVFLYDATTHVPLLMAGPGIPSGKVISEQVRSIDLMPTIAGYLGIPPGPQVQGGSLLPLIQGKGSVPDRYAFSETLYPKTQMGWSELHAVRTNSQKVIVAPVPEFYQLDKDPTESRNVLPQFPGEADKLKKIALTIAGAAGPVTLERQQVSEQTMRELQSLGYASAGVSRQLRLDMSGPDPKSRVRILKALEDAARLMNHDQYLAAIPILESSGKEDPGNPLIYQHLGMCYQRTRRYDKAVAIFQEAIRHHVETDQVYSQLGNNLLRIGQTQPALDAMEKAAELNLANLQNLANLATLYLQLDKLPEAEKTVKALLTQNDLHAEGNNVAGLIAIRRGNGPQARLYFEKAIQADPERAEPYMNLGLLAEQAGQTEAALENFRKFLEHARSAEHGETIPKVKAEIAELEKTVHKP